MSGRHIADRPVDSPSTRPGYIGVEAHRAQGPPVMPIDAAWPPGNGYAGIAPNSPAHPDAVNPHCERCASHDPRDRRDHGHLPAELEAVVDAEHSEG